MDTTPAHHTPPDHQGSAAQRFLGVIVRSDTYRCIAYLLLGLPLGIAWFTVVVTGVSVAASMVAVALLGIPLLLAMWYVTRGLANIERATANVLLRQDIGLLPLAPSVRGNVWQRLRSLTSERARWRELGYLMARFPVGVATATVAAVALTTPVAIAVAPFTARSGGDHPFGTWALSDTIRDVASSSPWSWGLIPLGAILLLAALHLLNALAGATARWTKASLQIDNTSDATVSTASYTASERFVITSGPEATSPVPSPS